MAAPCCRLNLSVNAGRKQGRHETQRADRIMLSRLSGALAQSFRSKRVQSDRSYVSSCVGVIAVILVLYGGPARAETRDEAADDRDAKGAQAKRIDAQKGLRFAARVTGVGDELV